MDPKKEIIKDYDKYIRYVLKKLRLSYRYDDLYDVAMIGFVKGLNTYDSTRNCKLTTYLYECIRRAILSQIYIESMKKRDAKVISLNTLVGDNQTDELLDFAAKEEDYERNMFMDEIFYEIDRRISFMTDRQQDIIKDLYGLDGHKELTPVEVAEKYNITKQNVYGIKKTILKKLRGAVWSFRDNYLSSSNPSYYE